MQKTPLLLLPLLLAASVARAQGVRVGTPGTPDPSAVLDLRPNPAAPKGLLPPCLTQAQRTAIASPATGLLVYQTDATAGYYYYTGTAWTQLGATGPAGPAGPTGDAGPQGATGPQGVISVTSLGGSIPSIAANAVDYVFIGPTTTVTIASSTQKLVGSASVPLGLSSGGPAQVRLSWCYQPISGGTPISFVGGNFMVAQVGTVRTSQAVSATVMPGPGTYRVGVAVLNSSGSVINNNDFLNAWLMVVN